MSTQIDARTLRKRVDLLRRMHAPIRDPQSPDSDGLVCFDCSQVYPCRVVRVLDGEITDVEDATARVLAGVDGMLEEHEEDSGGKDTA